MKLFNPPQGQPVERPGLILFALWLLIFSASSQIIIIAPILPVIGIQLNMPEALQGVFGDLLRSNGGYFRAHNRSDIR